VGCIERFPILEARARLSGSLITETGKAAPKMRIELLRKNQAGSWYATYQFWKQTDERGQFSFEGLPDGDYLLGCEIWHDRPSNYSPYPTTYFPGVFDRSSASVLHLVPKQSIDGLRLTLAKPHTPRSIRVEVIWPDGVVPTDHLLQLIDGSDLVKNVGGINPGLAAVSHRGIVEFTGYAERSYSLHVRYWIDDLSGPVPHDQQRIARSDVVRLFPGKEPAAVKLVLIRTMLADDDH
jgi:hypothetical protein